MFLERVSVIFTRDCRLDRGKPVLVGVSGGADSLCLLDLIVRAGFPVLVAHFDHGIRPEAKEDAGRVRKLAESLHFPVLLGSGDVPGFARQNRLSLEEAARILRYQFLFARADVHQAQAVAVAHHAGDQVETILMNLLRGAGMKGLCGMAYTSLPNPWSASIPLVRPLLGFWQEEIDSYCAEHRLEPVLDRTNLDTRYLRNRIRLELIPMLEGVAPGFKHRLWQTAEMLRPDQDVLQELAEQQLEEVLVEKGPGFVSLDRVLLMQQPLGLQRRLVRRTIELMIGNLVDVDYDLVERIVNLCKMPPAGGGIDAGLGIRTLIEKDRLFFTTDEAQLPAAEWPQVFEEIELTIPGEIQLGPGWKLRLEQPLNLQQARVSALTNADPNLAWFDPGEGGLRITVRSRQPGDRFEPLGMQGRSMKVSDYMINQKIPERARAHWPLLCVNDEIAWVVGYRLAETFRLRKETGAVIGCCLKNTSTLKT